LKLTVQPPVAEATLSAKQWGPPAAGSGGGRLGPETAKIAFWPDPVYRRSR
jgi:hypothetical protein